MALARSSRNSFSSLRSKWLGGKNSVLSGPRQAARSCQVSSSVRALTNMVLSLASPPPATGSTGSRGGNYLGRSAWTRVGLPVVTGASPAGDGLPRLDFEDEAVDGHHPDRAAGGHRGGPVGAGPPGGAPDGHDPVRFQVGPGLAQLADHRVPPHGRDREPVPDGDRHAPQHEDQLPHEDQA